MTTPEELYRRERERAKARGVTHLLKPKNDPTFRPMTEAQLRRARELLDAATARMGDRRKGRKPL